MTQRKYVYAFCLGVFALYQYESAFREDALTRKLHCQWTQLLGQKPGITRVLLFAGIGRHTYRLFHIQPNAAIAVFQSVLPVLGRAKHAEEQEALACSPEQIFCRSQLLGKRCDEVRQRDVVMKGECSLRFRIWPCPSARRRRPSG